MSDHDGMTSLIDRHKEQIPMTHAFDPASTGPARTRLSRRQALLALGANLALGAGVMGGPPRARAQATPAVPAASPVPAGALTPEVVAAFTAAVPQIMANFSVLGLGVALVQDKEIVFAGGFGVADRTQPQPVTADTRFRIASNSKAMTALLVATQVDAGAFGWDDRVIDVWPAFQAPTLELTASLNVADTLSMATGIDEPAVDEFFISAGTESALTAVRSIAHQPVIAAPGERYAYNNALYALAGYLGPLQAGTPPDQLVAAYTAALHEKLFTPTGMSLATVASDPRRLPGEYATGQTIDIFGDPAPLPFISIDGHAPAGSVSATATDLANFLIMQMNQGVAADGTRVVSAANWAVNHAPGVTVPPDAVNGLPSILLEDTAATHYAQGWFVQTFTTGQEMHWHAGGIDGFGSLMGFFPEERIGYVFLTNQDPATGGSLCNVALQGTLLGAVFGVNGYIPDVLASFPATLQQQQTAVQAAVTPVKAAAVARYLGLYTDGFQVRLDDDARLLLLHDIRVMELVGDGTGAYLVTNGPGVIRGRTVQFSDAPDGTPLMTIAGFDPARWLTGG